MKRIWSGWKPLGVMILLCLLWEGGTKIANIPAWLLPPPTKVVTELVNGWEELTPHLLSTIELILLGFALGVSIGLLTAVVFHAVPFLKSGLYPLLILSQNIPIIVLAPLLVIWFGFGLMPKLIVISLVCFFPVTVAALDGFRQTAPEFVHYMKMAGASKQQLFWKLELPSALPAIFSGLKISATYSVMGAVISEWLGAEEGIGVYMTLASSSFRTDRVFVAIVIIMGLSLLFFGLIRILERMMVKWREEDEF